MRIVIIGGGTAGSEVAWQLRKKDKNLEIIILEKGDHIQYSPCALPYVLSGEIKSFDDIFIFKKKDYQDNQIDLRLNSKVLLIDKENKQIVYEKSGKKKEIFYDKLVLATGAKPIIPDIPGLDNVDFFSLKTIDDAQEINRRIKPDSNSIIIGAGFIGLELAAALQAKKEKVYLLEAKDRPLANLLDDDMSRQLVDYLSDKGIKFFFQTEIKKIDKNQIYLGEKSLKFDKLFITTGMKPKINLAKTAGLKCSRAIKVNEYLQTSNKNIYACGDNVFSGRTGTIAVRQGRVAADNLLGRKVKNLPVLNNTISKIGNLFVGAVGLTQAKASVSGIDPVSAVYSGGVRSKYYPSDSRIKVKIIADLDQKIIGGQIIGDQEVVGRLNLISLAIQQGLTLTDLVNLEAGYNPASAPINEPVNVAAEICRKKIEFLKNG